MMMEPPTVIAQHDGNGAGRQQNKDQGIGKKAQKTDQRSEAGLRYQAVRAMQAQPLFGLGGSQPGGGRFEQDEQVPLGHIPEAVQRLVRFAHAPSPLNSTRCLGLTTPACVSLVGHALACPFAFLNHRRSAGFTPTLGNPPFPAETQEHFLFVSRTAAGSSTCTNCRLRADSAPRASGTPCSGCAPVGPRSPM